MKHDKILMARVDDKTIKNLDDVQKVMGLHSRSESVRRAISITKTLLSALKKGDQIVLISKNGDKREFMVD
jgi:hypothetical protein